MQNQVKANWREYDAQTERFIVFAELVTKHAKP